ncbi:MAG: hypothetical protein GF398_20140 [Chitinivibrionales bacterium]|nr:hypothetical protein [Chitinivibrionales bacterium]
MKQIITTTLLSITVLITCRFSQNPGAGADPTDLLPVNNDISGFERTGSAAIMTDKQTIYNAIDGAAEKYIDYGFIEGAQQNFSNGRIDVDVQVFNHGTPQNARAVFADDDIYPSTPSIINAGDPHVVLDLTNPFAYSILYQRNNIFLRINSSEKSDFALNMVKQFYLNIDTKIEQITN